ncbi:type II toxin-antitoxin system RelE/ParE family toxin [Arthrobacter sp. KNU-44]|uniref:type II toxin-antitoxin system RelE/ParE family toxin n=1 Tax=unclassified Arthrobacter TaxID=235627 RepID=UPI003F444A6F
MEPIFFSRRGIGGSDGPQRTAPPPDPARSPTSWRSPRSAGNRLEALKGDRAGQYSIRINDQWRICFRWTDAGPDAALRLGKYFGTSAQFCLNLQTHYDLDVAEDRAAGQIAAMTPLKVA